MYLNGTPGSSLALSRLWKVNPDFFSKSLLELYSKDATTLTRILEVVRDLKVIEIRLIDGHEESLTNTFLRFYHLS